MNEKRSSEYIILSSGAKVEFTAVTTWEGYDIRKSHDGGSYYQPTHEITWSDNGSQYTLTIEDTSCGDLGARIFAQLDKDDCCVAQAQYGSLASGRFTDFCPSEYDSLVALLIASKVGYNIPYLEA